MEKKEKRNLMLLIVGIITVIALTHFDLVVTFLGYVGNIILPIVIGLVLAFVLNVPVTGFEHLFQKIFAKSKRGSCNKAIHIISLVLTIIGVLLIITLLGTLVIPELINTVKSIAVLIEEHWPDWLDTLESHGIDTTGISKWFTTLDFENIVDTLSGNAGAVIGSIADVATSTVSMIVSIVLGIVIAIYVLISRETLGRQSKKVLYAYTKTKIADKICYICRLLKSAYTKFLTGQCVEAVILGMLIFISFVIFRLPYAGLIGVVTGICALIPYIGAYISCGLSVILALLISPQKALMCLVVYLVVQLVETQFIYPNVVGGTVGLSPLWTLLAVLIGGRLFGLMGMIFFIPLVSVVYTLLKEDVDRRITAKKDEVPPETLEADSSDKE